MSYFRPNIIAMTGYVPGEQPRGEKFIKLNTNENPFQCSPKVKAAIGRVVQAGLQKYPDPMATAFRIAAGNIYGIDPDWILCGNGSDEILTIITRAFVDSGDIVRYASPGYILYRTLAEIQGATTDVVNCLLGESQQPFRHGAFASTRRRNRRRSPLPASGGRGVRRLC